MSGLTEHALLRRVRRGLSRRLVRWVNADAFRDDFLSQLPRELHSSAKWIFSQDYAAEERQIAKRVEAHRANIPSLAATARLRSLPSPMPGTFELNAKGHSQVGQLSASSPQAHARTGVRPRGGVVLRRLVDGLRLGRVLELGTNTGMSGAYILSARLRPHLTTVEGSEDLCAIAEQGLRAYSADFRLMNTLFDDAIDTLTHEGLRYDAVFVDGQHEEKATIHYATRVMPLLRPGGVLIFDDIYWSHGMLAAWRQIREQPEFALSIDLAWKGVAIARDGIEERLETPPQDRRHFDLCEYVGRPSLAYKAR